MSKMSKSRNGSTNIFINMEANTQRNMKSIGSSLLWETKLKRNEGWVFATFYYKYLMTDKIYVFIVHIICKCLHALVIYK